MLYIYIDMDEDFSVPLTDAIKHLEESCSATTQNNEPDALDALLISLYFIQAFISGPVSSVHGSPTSPLSSTTAQGQEIVSKGSPSKVRVVQPSMETQREGIAGMKKQIVVLEADKSRLEEHIIQLQDEQLRLRAELKETQDVDVVMGRLRDIRSQLTAANTTVRQHKNQITSLQAEAEAKEIEYNRNQGRMSQLEHSVGEHTKNERGCQAEIDNLRKEHANLNSFYIQAQEELTGINEKIGSILRITDSQPTAEEQQNTSVLCDILSDDITTLVYNYDILATDNARLQVDLEQQQQMIDGQEISLQELETSVERTQSENKDLLRLQDSRKYEIRDRHDTLELQREDVDGQQTLAKEMEEANASLWLAESTISEQGDESRRLKVAQLNLDDDLVHNSMELHKAQLAMKEDPGIIQGLQYELQLARTENQELQQYLMGEQTKPPTRALIDKPPTALPKKKKNKQDKKAKNSRDPELEPAMDPDTDPELEPAPADTMWRQDAPGRGWVREPMPAGGGSEKLKSMMGGSSSPMPVSTSGNRAEHGVSSQAVEEGLSGEFVNALVKPDTRITTHSPSVPPPPVPTRNKKAPPALAARHRKDPPPLAIRNRGVWVGDSTLPPSSPSSPAPSSSSSSTSSSDSSSSERSSGISSSTRSSGSSSSTGKSSSASRIFRRATEMSKSESVIKERMMATLQFIINYKCIGDNELFPTDRVVLKASEHGMMQVADAIANSNDVILTRPAIQTIFDIITDLIKLTSNAWLGEQDKKSFIDQLNNIIQGMIQTEKGASLMGERGERKR